MASSSSVIQFPRLTSSPDIWNTTPDEFLYLPARPQNVRDGRKLKQSKSAESLTQRKDRVEFLRRREWTRRVSYGGDQPTSIPVSPSSQSACHLSKLCPRHTDSPTSNKQC